MSTSRRTAIVADRRPLERGLARFLLEERGLTVVAEAATIADVLLQVQRLRPDVLVLHEKLAVDHDPLVIAQIRTISPRTAVVLLAAHREALPRELLLAIDEVVTDGPGLTQLGAAVAGPPSEPEVVPQVEETDLGAEPVAATSSFSTKRWADRMQGMAAASVIAVAFLMARGFLVEPSGQPSPTARVHLSAAWGSLEQLTEALPTASPEEVAEIASMLISERAAALEAGADVSVLDDALLGVLSDVWTVLPPDTQALIVAILGDVFDDNDVPPPSIPPPSPATTPNPDPPRPEPSPPGQEPSPTESPSPSPSPSPTESPSPSPTQSPSPSPTQSPSPSPTESPSPSPTQSPSPSPTESPSPSPTESPSPSHTESPSPSPTESPSPSPTESPDLDAGTETTARGSLVAIPSMVTLLLALTGWARRRSQQAAPGRHDVEGS